MDKAINESLWFMTIAFEKHYTDKYPGHGAWIRDIGETLRRSMHLTAPSGGGSAGMLRNWMQELQENDISSYHAS